MSVQTQTLADFLLARIAEDEAVARTATPSPWVPDSQGWVDSDGGWIICAPYHDLDISDEDGEHVTRWQPARVLAECEAKRRIVGMSARVIADDEGRNYYSDGWDGLSVARAVLRRLALPYAGHDDYRDEWRP